MAANASANQFAKWEEDFEGWVDRVGYPRNLLGDFKLEPKYAEPPVGTVEFGKFKGQPKWREPEEHPDPEARELLLKLITIQGDTEFASVEQQKKLLGNPPTAYDMKSMTRVNVEEMRHGWQMAHILITHFGEDGWREAQGLLSRNAQKGERILQAFNDPVQNWLDFYCYTTFLDRDGKFQLGCLLHSGFYPLAASMGPMLKEEAFHLGTGVTGLRRVLAAGKVPMDILQRRVNWWVSTSLDCFGGELSRKAAKNVDLGFKRRYDEGESEVEVDASRINEYNQGLYMAEIREIVERLNANRPAGTPPIVVPSERFRRRVGLYKMKPYAADGKLIRQDAYEEYLRSTLPTPEDDERLEEVFKGEWIAPRQA
jgi:benzoyl-CoA 2,3-dioxygenase component B